MVKCTAEVHYKQNQAIVEEGAVRILRKQWTPEYKQQFFKLLGYTMQTTPWGKKHIFSKQEGSILHWRTSSLQHIYRFPYQEELCFEVRA